MLSRSLKNQSSFSSFILYLRINSVQKIQITSQLHIGICTFIAQLHSYFPIVLNPNPHCQILLVMLGLGISKPHFLDFLVKWLLIGSVNKRHQGQIEEQEEGRGDIFLLFCSCQHASAEVLTFRLFKDSQRKFQHALSKVDRAAKWYPLLRGLSMSCVCRSFFFELINVSISAFFPFSFPNLDDNYYLQLLTLVLLSISSRLFNIHATNSIY